MSAPELDDLGQQQTQSTSGGVHQRDISFLDRIEIRCEMAGRQSLHHDRSRRSMVDPAGNGDERSCRNHSAAGIAPGRVYPGNSVSRFDVVNACANGKHIACPFDAKHLGVWRDRPGKATAHTCIHEVNAGGHDLDQGIFRSRNGIRDLDMLKNFGTTLPGHNDSFHHTLLC